MRILRILEGKAQKSPTDHKRIGGAMGAVYTKGEPAT